MVDWRYIRFYPPHRDVQLFDPHEESFLVHDILLRSSTLLVDLLYNSTPMYVDPSREPETTSVIHQPTPLSCDPFALKHFPMQLLTSKIAIVDSKT